MTPATGPLSFIARARLRTKLLLAFLLIVVVSIGATGWQAFETARASIEEISFERLTSIRETKRRQIESYVTQLRAEAIAIAGDPRTAELCRALASEDRARAGVVADSVFGRLCITFGFDDLLLIDRDSARVLFGIDRALAGARLTSARRDLAAVAEAARTSPPRGSTRLGDFASSGRADRPPEWFLTTAVDERTDAAFVLVVRIRTDHINRVMTGDQDWRAEGFGRTGEAYIVGADSTMRTDSRFIRGGTVLRQAVLTVPAREALAGHAETRLATDYRGVRVLSSYAPLEIGDLHWVIIAEMDETEAFAPIAVLRERLMLVTVMILLLAAVFSAIIAQTITRPILALAALAERFGRGETTARAPIVANDEIGDLSAAFNGMAGNISAKTRQLESEIAERSRIEEELRASREEMRNLSRHLQRAREEERKSIAREVHDELGQALTTIGLNLSIMEKRLGSGDGGDRSTESIEQLRAMRELTGATIRSVKRIITELRPGLLDDLGLVAAIEWQAEEFERRTGIRCQLELPALDIELDQDLLEPFTEHRVVVDEQQANHVVVISN